MTPPEGSGPPDTQKTTKHYSRLVGLAFLVFAVFLLIQLLGNEKSTNTGLPVGRIVPKFAAPSATGTATGDSNVFQKTEAGHTGACEVEVKGAIRICDFLDEPLVLVIWSTKCGKTCADQVEIAERVSKRYPKVNFLALEFAGSIEETRKLVAKRGWKIPVAIDQDGAVAAMYNIALPPAVFFILPGGAVQHVATGRLEKRYMLEDTDRLVRVARERSDRREALK
jgi:hypothetical protein